ncbi:methyltransferase [Maricaulis sp.]|uniref:methyltransferase n=1 Tax=Maricaulis sp. TaxID=1486257 RepID=UPI002613796C|nr:methyltransferase [Maricaulis sp.]
MSRSAYWRDHVGKPFEVRFPLPALARRGAFAANEARSVESGLQILDLIEHERSCTGARILDFGCGVKIVQALIQRDAPQAFYLGIDVAPQVIETLKHELHDNPKFEFQLANYRNEMYRPNGEPMSCENGFGPTQRDFDILTMFSVVTHLDPDDSYQALKGCRYHSAEDGRAIFTAFIDPELENDFVDVVPDRPLLIAAYRKEYLTEIINAAGWEIIAHRAPIHALTQDWFVCRPV